jgi:endonuclease-3 related protein
MSISTKKGKKIRKSPMSAMNKPIKMYLISVFFGLSIFINNRSKYKNIRILISIIMNKELQIYDILLNSDGPQSWWPTTSAGEYIPKYSGDPINEKQQLEVIFGTILTQSTSWAGAEKAIINLNKKDLIDVDKIIKIDSNELALIIKPSGYFNQKAKKLKNICAFLKNNPINALEKLDIPQLRKKLLSVNGIGPETADSIILYSFSKPIFVVDAYTKRIFSRIGIVEKNVHYDRLQNLFHKNLDHDAKLFNEYHALIVEHGKRYCRKKPACDRCIVSKICKKFI